MSLLNPQTDEERSQKYDRAREDWINQPIAQQLLASGVMQTVIESLKNRRRVKPFMGDQVPLDIWLVRAVQGASRRRDVAETMTASERRNIAKEISENARNLSASLSIFHDETGFKWPFQPFFDRLALDTACKEEERLASLDIPMNEDTAHRCRYAVYNLLMNDLESIFEAIAEAAQGFAEYETVLKKPNDINADRLYFIRLLNRAFCREFRTPCRSSALAIASEFYDCSDLDEAALSKLAPYHRPKQTLLTEEELDDLREFWAERGKPTYVDDLLEHVKAESSWGNLKESSGE